MGPRQTRLLGNTRMVTMTITVRLSYKQLQFALFLLMLFFN
jgi:hypothetical protein